ncbi:MAG: hypothetical protein AMXMBFR57_37340 [Acidimicrobiia bacterium]|jgi:plasmid stability protein
MDAKRFQIGGAMPTLTLKNIPADLHARLKASAERNRRSLNSEILARLEGGGDTGPIDREAYSRDLRAFTAALPRVDHRLVAGFKEKGRA